MDETRVSLDKGVIWMQSYRKRSVSLNRLYPWRSFFPPQRSSRGFSRALWSDSRIKIKRRFIVHLSWKVCFIYTRYDEINYTGRPDYQNLEFTVIVEIIRVGIGVVRCWLKRENVFVSEMQKFSVHFGQHIVKFIF